MTVKTRLTEHKRRSSVNSEVTHPSTSKRPVALGLKIVPVDHRRLKRGVKETTNPPSMQTEGDVIYRQYGKIFWTAVSPERNGL